MLADGVLKIQYAVDLLRIKGQGWWIILLTAIIMAAAGIVVLFNPFASAVALMTFAGIFSDLSQADIFLYSTDSPFKDFVQFASFDESTNMSLVWIVIYDNALCIGQCGG